MPQTNPTPSLYCYSPCYNSSVLLQLLLAIATTPSLYCYNAFSLLLQLLSNATTTFICRGEGSQVSLVGKKSPTHAPCALKDHLLCTRRHCGGGVPTLGTASPSSILHGSIPSGECISGPEPHDRAACAGTSAVAPLHFLRPRDTCDVLLQPEEVHLDTNMMYCFSQRRCTWTHADVLLHSYEPCGCTASTKAAKVHTQCMHCLSQRSHTWTCTAHTYICTASVKGGTLHTTGHVTTRIKRSF